MYVRLAFSVAAHLEPEILVVDEVLAVGDADFQKKCLGKMNSVSKQEGRTVLFVSHNMTAIQNLCNISMVLASGRVSLPLTDTESAVSHYLEKVFVRSDNKIGDRKDRSGLGEIRITDFKITNSNHEEQSIITSGQKVFLKIYYKCFQSFNSLNLAAGISVTNSEGLLVTILSTEFTAFKVFGPAESGCIVCAIDKLPFSEGNYSVNIILRNNNIIQDWVLEADMLQVEDGDYFGTGRSVESSHKSVLIDQNWYSE